MTGTIVNIITFGTLHGTRYLMTDTIKVDLTEALRNPSDDPAMIELTGLDPWVRNHVMFTPGAFQIIDDALDKITRKCNEYPEPSDVNVAVFCRGGRHRSVVIAEELVHRLNGRCIPVQVNHLDVHKPVVR